MPVHKKFIENGATSQFKLDLRIGAQKPGFYESGVKLYEPRGTRTRRKRKKKI
ncbi:hypothetical protein QT987_20405 [Microcoleus sp. SVA1B4]|uniref:hypothetical protein n=1 Tax=Microcoleus sp. B4-C5 TaxID=2818664 RepID=UPI002FD53689